MSHSNDFFQYQTKRQLFWDQVHVNGRPAMSHYYQATLARIYQNIIPVGSSVLEIGCADGSLLNALSPQFGVGVDFSDYSISQAKIKFPHLNFFQMDAHELSIDLQTYDYIVLSELINDLYDVQKVLETIRPYCSSKTRIIFNFVSHLWGLPLRFARSTNLAQPNLAQNWLTKSDLENIGTLFPLARIQNSYGSTELGRIARHAFLPGALLPNDPLPVGVPFDCEVFIFEDNYGFVTQGGIGQIAVVSDRRSPKYLLANGPTALNEYEIRQGVFAVLTGDAGYFDEDGLLHVIGRMDDIVKINGNLTNMSSVSAVLMKHQDVANVEVLAFNNKKNRQKLGAVVVVREGASVTSSMLREYLLAELPTWMVPTRFEFVDALPVSSRGKTDRQKLLQQIEKSEKRIATITKHIPYGLEIL
jgi:acyl-CoA synthetase (AMP-forming)/AMP-acid ligase II